MNRAKLLSIQNEALNTPVDEYFKDKTAVELLEKLGEQGYYHDDLTELIPDETTAKIDDETEAKILTLIFGSEKKVKDFLLTKLQAAFEAIQQDDVESIEDNIAEYEFEMARNEGRF